MKIEKKELKTKIADCTVNKCVISLSFIMGLNRKILLLKRQLFRIEFTRCINDQADHLAYHFFTPRSGNLKMLIS